MTPEEQLNNEVFDLLEKYEQKIGAFPAATVVMAIGAGVIGTYAKDLSRNERRAFLRKIRGVFEFALKSEVK